MTYEDIYFVINEYRKKNKLPILRRIPMLEVTANVRAFEEWNEKDNLDHMEFRTPFNWFWVGFGEILARMYDDKDEMLQAWLDSPTHKAVIDDPCYYFAGVGIFKEHVCVFFGRPFYAKLLNSVKKLFRKETK